MKAIVCPKYGSPDVLNLEEVQKPTPKENEILVKVHAASANPLDWHIMRGTPYFVRLTMGLTKPKNNILGADIAGKVEEVGKNIKQFKPGDEVYGDISSGGFAEYVCVTEDKLVHKPEKISFEEAAALPVVALTALQGLHNKGKIQANQKLLINGASGGVGTTAVQIAKSFGTEVTGVCSTGNLDLVSSIGADHVIDYTKQDFTEYSQKYDLIYDTVGNRTVSDLKRALNSNGNCVIAGFTSLGLLFQHMLMGPILSSKAGKRVGLMETTKMVKDDLLFVNQLIETNKLKPVIDRCYPLSETADAIRYLEQGHARGKVIVTLNLN